MRPRSRKGDLRWTVTAQQTGARMSRRIIAQRSPPHTQPLPLLPSAPHSQLQEAVYLLQRDGLQTLGRRLLATWTRTDLGSAFLPAHPAKAAFSMTTSSYVHNKLPCFPATVSMHAISNAADLAWPRMFPLCISRLQRCIHAEPGFDSDYDPTASTSTVVMHPATL